MGAWCYLKWPCIYKTYNTKFSKWPILLACAFCRQPLCPRVAPWFSLHSSVIITFPPLERKDRNNPAEIYGSPGAKLLCQCKWKTRAAMAEWAAARSPVSWPHPHRHSSLHGQSVQRPAETCGARHSACVIRKGTGAGLLSQAKRWLSEQWWNILQLPATVQTVEPMNQSDML